MQAYLALEEAGRPGDARHEYWDGVIRAMGGASASHNRIVLALGSELRLRLKGSDCEAFVNDLRVRLDARRYVYPDVVVSCGPRFDDRLRPETLENPTLVIEVLSPSTTAIDRGDKLDGYRGCPSLMDYGLVDPERSALEHYARQGDGSWLVRSLGAGDVLRPAGLPIELPLGEVFEL